MECPLCCGGPYYITVALGFSTGNSLDQRGHVFLFSHEDRLWLVQCRDDQMTGVPWRSTELFYLALLW